MASCTVTIFSASSSEISRVLPSLPNSSSMDMMSSTRSRESAFRSSTKEALGMTWPSSTPNWSTMILRTRSTTVATFSPPFRLETWGLSGRHQAHRAQDAVDKSGGVVAAEGLGHLYRLVDGGAYRSPIIYQDFQDCKSEDIAVDRGELVDRPGGGSLGDHPVDALPVLQDAP